MKYVTTTGPCPRFGKDVGPWTRYSFRNRVYSYGLEKEQLLSRPLLTLYVVNVKEVTASHVETQLFTREFGQVRHESYHNLSRPEWQAVQEDLIHKAQDLVDNKVCVQPRAKPPFDLTGWTRGDRSTGYVWISPGPNPQRWILDGCRQTVSTIPSDDPLGDDPQSFVRALREFDLSAKLFGAPLPPQPAVDSVEPSSGGMDTEFTVTGDNFSVGGNIVRLNRFERGCAISGLHAKPLNTRSSKRQIKFTVRKNCGDKNGEYKITVSNGRSLSSEENAHSIHISGGD
jgi:hypothetical protein